MTEAEQQELIERISHRGEMASGALTYQGFVIREVFVWLEDNGYEVRKKSGLIVDMAGLDVTPH